MRWTASNADWVDFELRWRLGTEAFTQEIFMTYLNFNDDENEVEEPKHAAAAAHRRLKAQGVQLARADISAHILDVENAILDYNEDDPLDHNDDFDYEKSYVVVNRRAKEFMSSLNDESDIIEMNILYYQLAFFERLVLIIQAPMAGHSAESGRDIFRPPHKSPPDSGTPR